MVWLRHRANEKGIPFKTEAVPATVSNNMPGMSLRNSREGIPKRALQARRPALESNTNFREKKYLGA
jgi:hypothetical protein